MRKLLLCAATVALSGCSFLGLGGNQGYYSSSYNTAPAPTKACSTQQCYSRYNIEGGIGLSSMVDGRAVTGSQSASPALRNLSMRTMYDAGTRAEIGGSYALDLNTKVTATAHYEHADGSSPSVWGTTSGGDTFTGSLSDYESWGGELGLRHYFQPQNVALMGGSVRPYIEARAGASKVDDIAIQDAQLNGAVFNGGEVAFYDETWVATASGLIGFEKPLTQYSTLALETGLRYRGDLDADNSDISTVAPFLDDANDGGSSLSIPIMVRGRYRF